MVHDTQFLSGADEKAEQTTSFVEPLFDLGNREPLFG
jgi:hypothetical protein